jgi:quercetin dioxygenase-like cupin family protein
MAIEVSGGNPSGEGERAAAIRSIWFMGNLVTIHLTAEETPAGFSLVESWAPAGNQPPLHLHRADDEGFYVLEGRLRLWVGDGEMALEPGRFALAEHGIPHTYRVESEAGARWLVLSSTGEFDRFVAAAGVAAPERRLPDPAEPDLERLAELADQHGIELLGPPGALP